MNTYLILFILSAFAFILGLIEPSIVVWFNIPKTRFAVIVLYFSLSILFLTLYDAETHDDKTAYDKKESYNNSDSSLTENKQVTYPSDKDYSEIYKAKIDSVGEAYKKGDIDFKNYGQTTDTLLSAIDITINDLRNKKLKVTQLTKLYKKAQSAEIKNASEFLI